MQHHTEQSQVSQHSNFTCPHCTTALQIQSFDNPVFSCSNCDTQLFLSLDKGATRGLPLEWKAVLFLTGLMLVIAMADVSTVITLNQLNLTTDTFIAIYSHAAILVAIVIAICFSALLQGIHLLIHTHPREPIFTVITVEQRKTEVIQNAQYLERLKQVLTPIRIVSVLSAISVFILSMYGIGPLLKQVHESIAWQVQCEGRSSEEVESSVQHHVHCLNSDEHASLH